MPSVDVPILVKDSRRDVKQQNIAVWTDFPNPCESHLVLYGCLGFKLFCCVIYLRTVLTYICECPYCYPQQVQWRYKIFVCRFNIWNSRMHITIYLNSHHHLNTFGKLKMKGYYCSEEESYCIFTILIHRMLLKCKN